MLEQRSTATAWKIAGAGGSRAHGMENVTVHGTGQANVTRRARTRASWTMVRDFIRARDRGEHAKRGIRARNRPSTLFAAVHQGLTRPWSLGSMDEHAERAAYLPHDYRVLVCTRYCARRSDLSAMYGYVGVAAHWPATMSAASRTGGV